MTGIMVNEPRTRAVTGRDDQGYVMIVVGLLMFVLLVVVAFAVDFGSWSNTERRAQRAADQSALAAVSELVRVERITGDRAAAETAAVQTAADLARDNGFDDADSDITVVTSLWRDGAGVDHASVSITESDVDLYFAALVIDDHDITRTAEAALRDCQAVCGDVVLISKPLNVMLSTGTGGDGWAAMPTTNNLIFNLFHHSDGEVLQCTDRGTGGRCVGAPYPVEPYPNIVTNYAPPSDTIEANLYFVVQEPGRVGLGCWSGITHSRCAGFQSPVPLALYQANGGDANMRFAGPVAIDGRLFAYGDDNTMHCIDSSTAARCAGYPRDTPMAGVHDIELDNPASGFAGGVATSEQQHDMVATTDGKIFTTLTPADGETWIGCWDTVTAAGCNGWQLANTDIGRTWLFLHYDTSGNTNGVCARAGQGNGDGFGHECFDLNGNSLGSPIPWDFDSGGDKAGAQSVTGVTSSGDTVTYFPIRGLNGYRCWNWSIPGVCPIAPNNWSGTSEYAYTTDGSGCAFGLGHTGTVWTFDLDDGQFPCNKAGVARQTLMPCRCADGVNQVWTSLALTTDTDMSNFAKFEVRLYLPSGALLETLDFTQGSQRELDLRYLNDWPVPPTSLDVEMTVEIIDGREDVVFAGNLDQGVVLLPGIRPTLVG